MTEGSALRPLHPGYAALLLLLLTRAAPAGEATLEKVKAALPALDRLAEETLKSTGIPGLAIAVVYKDEAICLKGFGVRKVGEESRIDADTVFQLASVSKPIASTVLAGLVGEKVIGWDDRVIDRDPGFRMYDPWVTRNLTLRDLLCHRSGLPDQAGDLLEDMGYTRDEVLRRLRFLKPASSFRSKYAYTNFGYTEAAVAAARAAGKPWEDLCAEKLYRPLGMTSTSSRFKDFASAKNRADLHVRVGGKWVAKYIRDPDAQSPAGGVNSTARDVARWMRLQLAGGQFEGTQLVAAAALEETHKAQIVSGYEPGTNRASLYGLGWNVAPDHKGRVFWRHSGAFFLGARTEVSLLPAEGLGIAVLSNAGPTGIPEGINQSFFDLVFQGKLEKDWVGVWNGRFAELVKAMLGAQTDYSKPPAKKSPPLGQAAYVGVYGNAYFGDLEVVVRDGALHLLLGPKKASFRLRHWDRDVFVFQPTGESAGGPSGVRFAVGPDGQAATVHVENLDVDGQGTFLRVAGKR